MTKKIIILALLFTLAGCGRINIHNYKAHENEGLPKNKISILHATRYNYVHEIDGKGRYSPSRVSHAFPYTGAKIELLPGKHTLAVEYNAKYIISKGKSEIAFNFRPGKEYFLHSERQFKKNKVGGVNSIVVYHLNECGSKAEKEYNEREIKNDRWLDPFTPACGNKNSK